MEATIQTIDRLAASLTELQPMKVDYQQRLDKKLRLELNYNSNHIEGNTLTYGETELLLIFDKTTGNHELREYEEMKAHDVAFEMIKNFAKDEERPLNETMIKNLHEVLLVRPFWKDAITPDGQQTRRLIEVGAYKRYPNSVRLQNGEIFHYAAPEETPIQMGELIQWYRDEEQKRELHPVAIAALLHYKFVRIHPFDDGNGRLSRLLMNYVLLKYNLPPSIIKSADKKNYLFALNQADTGNLDAFVRYISEQLIWSLEMSIAAAKGENVEENNDWEKEISVFKRNFNPSNERKDKRSVENIKRVIKNSGIPLFKTAIEKFSLFRDLFDTTEHRIIFTNRSDIKHDVQKRMGGFVLSTNKFPETAYDWLQKKDEIIYEIGIDFFFKAYKRGYPLNVIVFLNFRFDEFTYHVEVKSNISVNEHVIENNYEDAASEETMNYVINDTAKKIVAYLKDNTQELNP